MENKSQEKESKEIPSEYRISAKWDKCIENFTLHFSAGLVAAGLTSLVVTRTRCDNALDMEWKA